jgi:hypothetical protein
VLQVIADFTGLNIIASDTVSGNVTLRLKDVPWDQALDIIMRAKGLDKRASGSVIWVAPRDELAAKEKQELEARKSMAELEALTTRSYRLNYLRADEALAVISGESDRSCWKPGSRDLFAEFDRDQRPMSLPAEPAEVILQVNLEKQFKQQCKSCVCPSWWRVT